MPSSPSQKASRTTWVNGLPTIPTAAKLAAERHLANYRAREGGETKDALVL